MVANLGLQLERGPVRSLGINLAKKELNEITGS